MCNPSKGKLHKKNTCFLCILTIVRSYPQKRNYPQVIHRSYPQDAASYPQKRVIHNFIHRFFSYPHFVHRFLKLSTKAYFSTEFAPVIHKAICIKFDQIFLSHFFCAFFKVDKILLLYNNFSIGHII